MTERGQKIRDAFRKKYGVDHPSQLPSVKEKIRQKRLDGAYDGVSSKMKETLLKRYGNENYVNVEKAKETKQILYGDPYYNNRDKMIQTNISKYGMKVSPNTLKSTTERSTNGELGFASSAYAKYLEDNKITNVSQLEAIREKRSKQKIQEATHSIFRGDRLKNKVIPLFKESEYKGTDYNTIYSFRCIICGNVFEDNLYSGNIPRCLNCYPHNRFHSKIEDEIVDFLKSLGMANIKQHDRAVLGGDEIDILIPEKNIGIEVDGIIWHSELFGKKDKTYHLDKTDGAKLKNVNLIHIWDWEWLNKREIVKSIILNKNEKCNKIFARKCVVVKLNETEKSGFLQDNHIQGNDRSSVKLGLLYNSKIVSVMTFSKSRYDKNYEWELTRFCNMLNTSVIGGASKLLSYFVKNYIPQSMVSYSDRRFFGGNVYTSIGMKLINTTPPNYHYFHKNNCVPISRLQFQKHKLISILKTFDPNLTEWQNMQLNGYDRIWDCGHYKFEWVKTPLP